MSRKIEKIIETKNFFWEREAIKVFKKPLNNNCSYDPEAFICW